MSDPKNLLINYIPNTCQTNDLQALFAPYGEIESCRIIHDHVTGQPKGYGFVKFKEEQCASNAIACMDGYRIHNKRLRVSVALGHGRGKDSPGGGPGGSASSGQLTGSGTSSPLGSGQAPALQPIQQIGGAGAPTGAPQQFVIAAQQPQQLVQLPGGGMANLVPIGGQAQPQLQPQQQQIFQLQTAPGQPPQFVYASPQGGFQLVQPVGAPTATAGAPIQFQQQQQQAAPQPHMQQQQQHQHPQQDVTSDTTQAQQ